MSQDKSIATATRAAASGIADDSDDASGSGSEFYASASGSEFYGSEFYDQLNGGVAVGNEVYGSGCACRGGSFKTH